MELDEELIQKLKNGEIYLKFDANFDKLEELQKIIKEAFPLDESIPGGVTTFYCRANYNITQWSVKDRAEGEGILLKDFFIKFQKETFTIKIHNRKYLLTSLNQY